MIKNFKKRKQPGPPGPAGPQGPQGIPGVGGGGGFNQATQHIDVPNMAAGVTIDFSLGVNVVLTVHPVAGNDFLNITTVGLSSGMSGGIYFKAVNGTSGWFYSIDKEFVTFHKHYYHYESSPGNSTQATIDDASVDGQYFGNFFCHYQVIDVPGFGLGLFYSYRFAP